MARSTSRRLRRPLFPTTSATASGCFRQDLGDQFPKPGAAGKVAISWFDWALALAPVGILLLLAVPLLAFKLYPPEVAQGAEVADWAAGELRKMGGLSRKEATRDLVGEDAGQEGKVAGGVPHGAGDLGNRGLALSEALTGCGKGHHWLALKVASSPRWKRISPASVPSGASLAEPAPKAGSISSKPSQVKRTPSGP
jgi:Sodium:sulfate symporter transmembrane region